MELFHIFSAVLSISALFAYLNQRFFRLPSGIALMIAGMGLSLVVQAIAFVSPAFKIVVENSLETLNFSEILLEFMLSFLLFAGSLHTDFSKLAKQKWPILTFATLGVLISTVVIGGLLYYGLILLDRPIDLIYCFLFGALISPTDPIAVMGILKKAGVPSTIEAKITGESLFNDGVGVVIFLTIFQIAQLGLEQVTPAYVTELLVKEIVGGIGLGLLLGFTGYQLMKTIDDYRTEVLLTLAIVMGGYSLAHYLHFSGPLAMVAAGLFVGNTGHRGAMSDQTADYVNKFWEMTDEILNAVLFVLIGLELLVVQFSISYVIIGLLTTVMAIGVRYMALAFPSYVLKFKESFAPNTLSIMTWGGLRGGISIALALSLTAEMERELIVAITYTVVLFSLIIQGLTLEGFVKRLAKKEKIGS